jgi:hypothetical protein
VRVSDVASADAAKVGTMRDGILENKFLLIGQDGSPNNYVLTVGRAGAGGWQTPRHRHNFDQIRYVLEGDYPYEGEKVLPEGWVGYFPESVYYGPQARPEGLLVMGFQFGGASGAGYLSVEQREAANAALAKKGTFKAGMYTYVDENGQTQTKDGSVACFEEAMGKPVTLAEPRYNSSIIMNPAAFAWMPGPTAGSFVKWLGSFTERNTRIGFVRLEANATFEGGLQSSMELLFLRKGRILAGGREYKAFTALEFVPGEGPIAVRALEESELLRIVLPQF